MNYQCPPAMIYHKLLFRERYSDQVSRTDNLFHWFLAARRPVVLHHTGNYISPSCQPLPLFRQPFPLIFQLLTVDSLESY